MGALGSTRTGLRETGLSVFFLYSSSVRESNRRFYVIINKMFRARATDESSNAVYLQGAYRANSNVDVARIVLQNYDADSRKAYALAAISVRDPYANADSNGFGDLLFMTSGNGSNLSERMRVRSDGRVGVGTAHPQEMLDVAGDAAFASVSARSNAIAEKAFLAGSNDSESSPAFASADGEAGFYRAGPGSIGFATAGASRARLDENGFSTNGASAYAIDVGGDVNVSGSIYLNGQPYVATSGGDSTWSSNALSWASNRVIEGGDGGSNLANARSNAAAWTLTEARVASNVYSWLSNENASISNAVASAEGAAFSASNAAVWSSNAASWSMQSFVGGEWMSNAAKYALITAEYASNAAAASSNSSANASNLASGASATIDRIDAASAWAGESSAWASNAAYWALGFASSGSNAAAWSSGVATFSAEAVSNVEATSNVVGWSTSAFSTFEDRRLFASNSAASASNQAYWDSNAASWASGAISAALFEWACNASTSTSNVASWASNSRFGVYASAAASWACNAADAVSNAARWSSNGAAWASNAASFSSNSIVWSSSMQASNSNVAAWASNAAAWASAPVDAAWASNFAITTQASFERTSNASAWSSNAASWASNSVAASSNASASNAAAWASNAALVESNSIDWKSNLTIQNSNRVVGESNVAVWASNVGAMASNSAIWTSNLISISVRSGLSFASNAAAWGSNEGAWGSNAGAWGSNAAAWGSNAARSASNAGGFSSNAGAWGSNAGAWGSNAAAWGSNVAADALVSSASNSNMIVFGSNVGAWASNAGAWTSNSGAWSSNAGAWASNAGAWSSNAALSASNEGRFASNAGAWASNAILSSSNAGRFASNAGAWASNANAAAVDALGPITSNSITYASNIGAWASNESQAASASIDWASNAAISTSNVLYAARSAAFWASNNGSAVFTIDESDSTILSESNLSIIQNTTQIYKLVSNLGNSKNGFRKYILNQSSIGEVTVDVRNSSNTQTLKRMNIPSRKYETLTWCEDTWFARKPFPYTAYGEINWVSRLSSAGDDRGLCIVGTSDGGVLAVGYYSGTLVAYHGNSESTTTFASSLGPDVFIAKYASTGSIEWTARIAGSQSDQANALCLSSDAFYVGGIQASSTLTAYNINGSAFATTLGQTGSGDAFVVKYMNSGSVSWIAAIAGSSDDRIMSMCSTDDGGVIVYGYFTSSTLTFYNSNNTAFSRTLSATGNAGVFCLFFAKYSSGGTVQWIGQMSSTGTNHNKIFGTKSVTKLSDGGFCFAATITTSTTLYNTDGTVFGTYPSLGGDDMFLIKINASGSYAWVVRQGTVNGDNAYSVSSTTDGYLYVGGYYFNTTFTAYNADGSAFGTTIPITGINDAAIVKYTNAGTVAWIARIAGTGDDRILSLETTLDGGVCVTGYYKANLTAYHSNGAAFGTTLAFTSGAIADAFVVKYSSSGTVVWVSRLAGSTDKFGFSVASASDGNVYVAGSYNCNPLTIYEGDSNAYPTTLSNSGSYDAFLVKYTN